MKQAALETAILELLVRRAPNWVSELTLQQRSDNVSEEELESALESLANRGAIVQETDPQDQVKRPRRYFRLPSYESVPIRETIRVGDVEVPRVLSTAGINYSPENINEAIEGLAEQSATIEKRFHLAVQEQHSRYWANVVGLFGVFASVIALVVAGLSNLQLDAESSFWESLLANLSILLPMAVVLGVFVVCVRWIVR